MTSTLSSRIASLGSVSFSEGVAAVGSVLVAMSESQFLSSMRRESLRAFFDGSPTARLLRSDLAPLIIDFLNRTFKSGEVISLGQAELRTRLSIYQEELHDTEPDLLIGPPDRYLIQWSDVGWLQRFLESASVEPQFQLTRYAEEAIRFVDSALSRGNNLVGTESRLRLVIETLEDIVRGASADPDRRLEYLRAQRAVIDDEIAAIESGKSVQSYRPAQIRERFQTAVELLKTLQSDFRAVEERFQAIAREVQQLQAQGNDSRGGILGYALDAEDLLKTQDEGISFFAFVTFLFSPSQQAALLKNIGEIQQLAALADQHDSLTRVRRMVPALLAEADKVMRTTARLSATLRRLLDARAAAHRMRLATVLRDIRQAALKLKGDDKLVKGIELTIETAADIASPIARTFWTAAESFQGAEILLHQVDQSQAAAITSALARLQRLDFRRLRRTIREVTSEGASQTLAALVERFPISGGVVELLGYLQVAHDDGHLIDPTLQQDITVEETRGHDRPMSVRVPHVTFVPKAGSKESGRKPR